MPGGQPPVMTHDVAGNAVVDPRELEKNVDLAEESRKSNDNKDAQQAEFDNAARERLTTSQDKARQRAEAQAHDAKEAEKPRKTR